MPKASKETSGLRVIYFGNHILIALISSRKFILYFTPSDSLHDNVTDTDDNSDLVADIDPDILIRIVRSELENGKAPGIDNVCNDIFKKAIGTGFHKRFGSGFNHIIETRFYSICLEGSSPLYAHQA